MDGQGMPPTNESRDVSTGELIRHALDQTQVLLKEEIALAKDELRQQMRSETKMVAGLGVGAICALYCVALLLAAAVLGLATALPGWAAALIVGAVVGIVGLIAAKRGWDKRVRTPLERTKKTAKEDIQWAKEKMH